jgi:hypothetical protein
VEDAVSTEQLSHLVDFLRRGLVAYVGTDKARELAEACEASIALPDPRRRYDLPGGDMRKWLMAAAVLAGLLGPAIARTATLRPTTRSWCRAR